MSTIAATIDQYRTHVGLSPSLQRPTLVLNRNWQPINVATVARALIMLWNDSAKIVDPVDYQLYDWSDWSRLVPDRGEPFIQSVRQRIRIPEVVALTKFDAMPTQTVNARRAMFGWLTDKEVEKWAPATEADLPVEVQSLIAYRDSESEEAQALIAGGLENVRWDLWSDAAKGPMVWAVLARKMGPQALRMNLNTLLRHGVFNSSSTLRVEDSR
ncbi:MAG: hypothetical protein SGI77_11525, partial [Pirellulaceae bacterium]|nr:hypothetical protein [Pirellulaceae bacterium]